MSEFKSIEFNDRQRAKLRTFAMFARELKHLSTCVRSKVGAIIVPKDFTAVISLGYNGQLRGRPNDGCNGEIGKCGCVHAEINALLKLRSPLTGLTMISTLSPCVNCAGAILNCPQIDEVLFIQPYRDLSGIELLESRIEVRRLEL